MSPTPDAKAKWRGKHWLLYKATMLAAFEEKNLEHAGTAVTMTQQLKLQHQLRSAKMKKGSDMAQHLNELFLIRTKLEATSYKVSDSEMVEAILRSLPDAYSVSHDIVQFSGTDYTAEKLRNALLLKHEDLANGDTTTKSTTFGEDADVDSARVADMDKTGTQTRQAVNGAPTNASHASDLVAQWSNAIGWKARTTNALATKTPTNKAHGTKPVARNTT
ncbi:TPA: hypothetical protein N0F65_012397 [Lagenidium giganteum]|uniref:Gag protein n=1 Tax=Lagenidium giganteum TaxID=4803 RepID=A0AAV2YPK4_9STRA|nr:TPA: hypothetical protein N0F65_012397 [Lagenidium giganteum]